MFQHHGVAVLLPVVTDSSGRERKGRWVGSAKQKSRAEETADLTPQNNVRTLVVTGGITPKCPRHHPVGEGDKKKKENSENS